MASASVAPHRTVRRAALLTLPILLWSLLMFSRP